MNKCQQANRSRGGRPDRSNAIVEHCIIVKYLWSAGSTEQQALAMEGPLTYRQLKYLCELLQQMGMPEEEQRQLVLQIPTRERVNWLIRQCLPGQT